MKVLFVGIVVAFFSTVQCGIVTKKDRVVDLKLSDKEPGTYEYDQEAFMGEEAVDETSELSPEESKEYLRQIVYKLDSDGNDEITMEEMKDWIEHTRRRHSGKRVNENMQEYDTNQDGHITWDEYHEKTFGYLTEDEMDRYEKEDGINYRDMIKRDKRRWEKADKTGDDVLDFEELHHFLFPEDYDFMRAIVIKETFEDIDKNKDGVVDLNEYIGDLYQPEDGEDQPEWVETEKEQFTTVRDKDGNGSLDEEEIADWIFPDGFDHVDSEAQHLLRECDDNKDGVLSMEEILEHHQNFVQSQITNWGDDLRIHHEL